MKEDYTKYFADWEEGKISESELKDKISEKEWLNIQKIDKTFDLISKLEAPLDATLLEIKKQIHLNKKAPKKAKIIPLFAKWALSIAAVFVLFIGIRTYFSNTDITVNSNFGEQKTVSLFDGSDVVLNAKSSITYNKTDWKKKRELFLKGEAYFKVTKGSTFTVNTANGSITVLGTQFNVISNNDYLNVICYEGKVKVVEGKRVQILTHGKGTSTNNSKQDTFNTENSFPSWIQGESEFTNVPLRIVIDKLEKQFQLSFDRTAIDQAKNFTGSFNNKNLKIALASVFKTMQIKYKREGNVILLRNETQK